MEMGAHADRVKPQRGLDLSLIVVPFVDRRTMLS